MVSETVTRLLDVATVPLDGQAVTAVLVSYHHHHLAVEVKVGHCWPLD